MMSRVWSKAARVIRRALASRWAAAGAVWLACGWAAMITWHVGTLLLKPAAVREDHYAFLFYFGTGAGLAAGIAPAVMTAELIRRLPVFRAFALRLVPMYCGGLLAVSLALDVARAGSLVTLSGLLTFGAAVGLAPLAMAAGVSIPEAMLMGALAVLPLAAVLWGGYRNIRRALK